MGGGGAHSIESKSSTVVLNMCVYVVRFFLRPLLSLPITGIFLPNTFTRS